MKQIMWAWHDKKRGEFRHIYSKRFCVEICFPDGGKSSTERGDGEIAQVEVRILTKPT